MSAYILDPTLASIQGHHAHWATLFTTMFEELGHATALVGSVRLNVNSIEGIAVTRYFTQPVWHADNQTDILKNWDWYFKFNGLLERELENLFEGKSAVFTNGLSSADIVVFPTVIEFHLTGIVNWLKKLPEERRPLVFCYLMGPSGSVYNKRNERFEIYSLDTSRFYKLAFREARSLSDNIRFFALGDIHADQYSFLYEADVPSYPVIADGVQHDGEVRQSFERRVVLYCGEARSAKGARFLPELVELCCAEFPEWVFTVHLGVENPDKIDKSYMDSMSTLDKKFENFNLILGLLHTVEYCDLLGNSEIMVVPYNRSRYFNQSSGILWEAIATANTLVLPQGCWLMWEAISQGADFVAFDGFDAESVFDALVRAIQEPGKSRSEKISVAQQFREQNRLEILKRQIANALDERE